MRIGMGILAAIAIAVGLLYFVSARYAAPADPAFVIENDVIIEAAQAEVWQVLTDFAAYPDWNPYATRIEGELVLGGEIDLTITQPNWSSPMRLTPTLVRLEPGDAFGWHGQLLWPGVHDTDHYFELEALGPERTRLHHAETFRGWLVERVTGPEEREFVRSAFQAMNEALKRRVEEGR